MRLSSSARQILIEGNFRLLLRVSGRVFPHLPAPENEEQAEVIMHHARTLTPVVPFRLRAWSHKWLIERDLPSGLPDELRPKAEQIHPVIIEAVGLAVGSSSAIARPAAIIIRGAMEDAVQEAFADGRTDPAFLRGRIEEARRKSTKQLFGKLTGVTP